MYIRTYVFVSFETIPIIQQTSGTDMMNSQVKKCLKLLIKYQFFIDGYLGPFLKFSI